jgi:hypothetical protein
LSLIIDGADQSKHGIPHSCGKSHASDAAWKLKLHLMGVIAHFFLKKISFIKKDKRKVRRIAAHGAVDREEMSQQGERPER